MISELGKGGMGVVYHAESQSGRHVAIKVLRKEHTKDDQFIQRFIREVKILAKLDNPSIVNIIDTGYKNGTFYYVMEYVEGNTADKLIKTGPLKESQCIMIAIDVANALDVAHKVGIIHRDIKPQNILVGTDGRARLLDFGIAKRLGGEKDLALTVAGGWLGTPTYMSPEQIFGKKDIGPESDIYSLGATLYHLSCGRPPFEGETTTEIMIKQIEKMPTPPRVVNENLSPELNMIITKALRKKPEERFRSTAEFVGKLKELLQSSSLNKKQSARIITARRQTSLDGNKIPIIATSVVTGIVLLVLAIVLFIPKNPEYSKQVDFNPQRTEIPDNEPSGKKYSWNSNEPPAWLKRNNCDITEDHMFRLLDDKSVLEHSSEFKGDVMVIVKFRHPLDTITLDMYNFSIELLASGYINFKIDGEKKTGGGGFRSEIAEDKVHTLMVYFWGKNVGWMLNGKKAKSNVYTGYSVLDSGKVKIRGGRVLVVGLEIVGTLKGGDNSWLTEDTLGLIHSELEDCSSYFKTK